MTPATSPQEWIDQVVVDSSIFELRPDYVAGICVAFGLDGGPSDAVSEALLRRAEAVGHQLDGQASPHVTEWHDAYRAFGEKPKRTRVSVDSLTRRAAKNGLPRISRVVDVYNAISVIHQTPIGAEDIDHYAGPLRFVRSNGTETFLTNKDGEQVDDPPQPGEPVWRDDLGVTCRRWNWRQTNRTAVTATSKNLVFIIDTLGPNAEELVSLVAHDLQTTLDTPGAQWAHTPSSAPDNQTGRPN